MEILGVRNISFQGNEYKEIQKIGIPFTDNFDKASKDISDFIQALPLNSKDNEELIHRLKEYCDIIRRETFTSGIIQGLELERLKLVQWKYEKEESHIRRIK